jgi:proteasome lid subunit RPN8/RPN11
MGLTTPLRRPGLSDGKFIDVASLDVVGLAHRSIESPDKLRTNGFEVVFARSAWDAMQTHAHSADDVEVGGVMLGQLHRDSSGPFLFIHAIVPALQASQRATSVTFTGETWAAIHQAIDRDHPGSNIAGWYHTHPGFGVFLSDMDEFIQRSFFDLPYQAATVIDPKSGDCGTFVWRANKLTREAHLVENAGAEEGYRAALARLPAKRGPIGQVMDVVARLDSKRWLALVALLCVGFSVVFYAMLVLLDGH